jgi:hypothetical protein
MHWVLAEIKVILQHLSGVCCGEEFKQWERCTRKLPVLGSHILESMTVSEVNIFSNISTLKERNYKGQ